MLVVQVFCQLGNALGVCFCFEAEASTLKESPQFLVIGDDTIMNDGKFPLGIRPVWVLSFGFSVRGMACLPVRMAIQSTWLTVCGPSCVCNACV